MDFGFIRIVGNLWGTVASAVAWYNTEHSRNKNEKLLKQSLCIATFDHPFLMSPKFIILNIEWMRMLS